jgi:hypothetical protein
MLGTTQAGMQFLDDLLPESKEPRTFPIDYSEFVELGSGVRLGQGWLRCLWHWDVLTETDRNTLYGYVGSVYIDTLDNDGTIQTCTALMVWPEKEPEHFNNRVIDLNIEFRQIVRV